MSSEQGFYVPVHEQRQELYIQGASIWWNDSTISLQDALALEPSINRMLDIITPCRHQPTMAVLNGDVWRNKAEADAGSRLIQLDSSFQFRILVGLLLEEVLQEGYEFSICRLYHDVEGGHFVRSRLSSPFSTSLFDPLHGDGPWRNSWTLAGHLAETMDVESIWRFLDLLNTRRKQRGGSVLTLDMFGPDDRRVHLPPFYEPGGIEEILYALVDRRVRG